MTLEMFGKALLLYNPVSGRLRLSARRLNRLVERIHGMGVEAEVVPSQTVPTPLNLENKDLLIVLGGDGTIHSALPEAVRWKVPLALLPSGTANVLASELGIPRHPDRALRLIRSGRLRRIHLGRGDARYFHLMAGIGVDGYVLRQTSPRLKRTLGTFSYWWAGMRHFWTAPLQPFEIRLDDRAYPATFAVISNCRYYGGQLLMAPRATVFENCLDVCLFNSQNRLRFIQYLLGSVRGGHIHYPDVIYQKVTRIEVLGDSRIPVQMDGDVIGNAPMCFDSFEEGVEILCP